MQHTTKILSQEEINQVNKLMKKDIRVKELYKTLKERPLNELETLIFNQIYHEYIAEVIA